MTRRLTGLLFVLLGSILGLLVPAQAAIVSGHLVVVGHENYCPDVGSTDAYACSLSETITTYTTGARYAFRANTANTGPATLALSGLSAVAITRQGAALSTGDILAGQIVVVGYDGTSFQCLSCGGAAGGAGTVTIGTAGHPAYYPSTSTTVDDATGLTFTTDGTTLASLKYRVTTKSASATLGPADGPIVACTAAADVTLTLPAASSEQGVWTIIKVDGGAGACKVARGGSDTINGGTSTVDATVQWQRIDLVQASTTNWASVLGVLQVNLATQVTGDLPYANLTPATTASKLLGRGDSSAGDWQEVTLGANLAMTGTTLSAAGDVTDVWACTTGNCSALTAAAGDTLDAGSATAASPTTRSTAVPGTCTEGQHHQDTDAGGSETYVCTATNTWAKLAAVTDSLTVFAATTSAQLAGVLSDEAGTGVVVLNVRPTLTVQDSTFIIQDNGDNTKQAQFMAGAILTGTTRTYTLPDANITVAGVDTANAWADGVRQTFNPSGTTPGLNVGAQAGDPSTPTNGDLWYDSTANELTARINGANVALGGGGVSGTITSSTAGSVTRFPSTGTTVEGSTALTLSSTAVDAVRYRRTAVSATGTLGPADGPIIECTAASDIDLTLPTAASGTQSWYYIVKVDSGTGDCIVHPAGGQRINGTVDGTITVDTQWNYVVLVVTSTTTPNWHAVAGLQTVLTANLANDAVTYAKMQNVSATDRVLCRDTAAAGDMEECTVTAPLQFTGGPGLSIAASSDTASGVVRLATSAETTTGTENARAVTPLGLAASTVLRSIYIPAGNFDVNGACALGAPAVLVASGPKTMSVTCTDSTADSMETHFTMPDGWDAGTLTIELTAFNVGTNASTLVYEVSWIAKCVGTTEAPGAWAAVNHSTDAATSLSLTTTDNVLYHATSGPLTPAGGCTAGDTVFLKGELDATATTMTPMADLKILGAKIEYARTRGSD